jgi:hypothetical protein
VSTSASHVRKPINGGKSGAGRADGDEKKMRKKRYESPQRTWYFAGFEHETRTLREAAVQ